MKKQQSSFHEVHSENFLLTLERIFYYVAFCYFAYQAFTFAYEVPFSMPPDEKLHTYGVSLFAKISDFFPAAASLPPVIGDKALVFPLYYKTMGLLLLLLERFGLGGQIIDLRIANIVLGLINVFVCLRFIKLIFKTDPIARVLSFTLYVTLLMFPFISSAVNWDNLSNMLSMLGIYFCFLFLERKVFFIAGCFFLVCGLGIISKSTALPVFLILSCMMLVSIYRNRALLGKQIHEALMNWKGRFAIVSVVFFALIFLTSVFHLTNIIAHYGTVLPSCSKIYSKQQCLKENIIFKKYEALRVKEEADPTPLLDPLSHFVIWSDLMVSKVLGVFAYKSWYPPRDIIVAVELLILFSLVQLIRSFSLSDRTQVLLLMISLFYIVVLFGYVNYRSYLVIGIIPRYTFVGIQGRYLFPILAPIVVLFSKNLLKPFTGRLRTILALGVCLFFFGIGFPLIMSQNPVQRYIDNTTMQNAFIEAVTRSQQYLFD